MFIPISTYRVQLNKSFTFKHLDAIIDYLEALGITTIYASPITSADKGSTHGYDVIDPNSINPEIGTREELESIAIKLKERNMTWIQDIVPNHMAFSFDNTRLVDVLERGKHSPFYKYFDINWEHPAFPGQVMVPFLGEELNIYLEKKQVSIRFTENGFRLVVEQQEFPLSIQGLKILVAHMNEQHVPLELIQLLEKNLEYALHASLEDWSYNKKQLIETYVRNESNKNILHAFLNALSKDTAILLAILQAQPYLPVCYKITDSVMNYRRFFTINNLICLRMEDEWVFQEYHSLLFDLYRKNIIQGFRLDHVDGLYNPHKYIQRLHQSLGEDCYIIVEKILESKEEELPENWNVRGTTGYEFLSETNRILTNKKGSVHIVDFYKSFTGLNYSFEDICFDKKHSFLYNHMGGELSNLMRLYEKISFKVDGIENVDFQKALGVFMSAFPIYRIYPEIFPLPENELIVVETAFDRSLDRAPELDIALTFIKNLFVQSNPQIDDEKLFFIKRLMQYTSPLAAKGVEDTTFYVYNPLISHNEVGDSPEPLSYSLSEFHEKMCIRKDTIPYSLNASSTHDTKRGENARSRINALTYYSKDWIDIVTKWHIANAQFIKNSKGNPAPSLNDAYFIYQSLIGSFPESGIVDQVFIERTKGFLIKALREAKVETNYDAPNNVYEDACLRFVELILTVNSSFLHTFIPFLNKLKPVAASISLSEVVLKSTAPGIPDLYQGCEFNDLSYVDPDNRRAVDYDMRRNILNEIISLGNNEEKINTYLYKNKNTEVVKLFVIHKLLLLRKIYPHVFLDGEYIPLENHSNLLAFVRHLDSKWILVLIPLNEFMRTTDNVIPIDLLENLTKIWKNLFTEKIYHTNNNQLIPDFSKLPIIVLESNE